MVVCVCHGIGCGGVAWRQCYGGTAAIVFDAAAEVLSLSLR